MDINKILKVIRVLTWIAFILLAFLSVYYKYDNCNVCKFEYENNTLDASQFMQVYSSKCLVTKEIGLLPSYNLTFVKP